MAYFSSRRLTIAKDPDLKVGDNYKLCNLFLLENVNRFNRETREWEQIGTNAFSATIFGDKAIEASMLPKGTSIKVMPSMRTNQAGEEYLSFPAKIEDRTYTNKQGEEVTTQQIVIHDFEVL